MSKTVLSSTSRGLPALGCATMRQVRGRPEHRDDRGHLDGVEVAAVGSDDIGPCVGKLPRHIARPYRPSSSGRRWRPSGNAMHTITGSAELSLHARSAHNASPQIEYRLDDKAIDAASARTAACSRNAS